MTDISPYERLLPELLGCRTSAELRARLVQGVTRELPEQVGLRDGSVRDEPGLELEWRGGGAEPEAFSFFRRAVDELRLTISQLERAARLDELGVKFMGFGTDAQIVQECLHLLLEEFSLSSVQVLHDRQGSLRAKPEWSLRDARDGSPDVTFSQAEMLAWRGGQTLIRPDGLLLPLASHWRPRLALWLGTEGARTWPADVQRQLTRIGRVAGVEAERILMERRLSTLLSMQRQLLEGNPEDAYRPLLVHALELIPGAESGSLLVLEDGRFRFAAAVTFDDSELSTVTFSIKENRDDWYGLGLDAWYQGVPRILRGSSLQVQGSGFQQDGTQHSGYLPSVNTIASTIGVPILHHGEVYAFLNIDSHTDPDAFGEDSVEVATSFATQAALLLHEAWQRHRIWQAARTDVLTGLPNRRAFTEQLAQEVERAHHAGAPLSLLIGDVAKFKAINDAGGHEAGDAALVQIGEILRACAPPGAQAFRWAGDEFALLLPGTTLQQAEEIKARVSAELVGRSCASQPLRLTMGAAQLTEDDLGGQILLQQADAAMYAEKGRREEPHGSEVAGPR